jgi:hypothetical protein
MLLHWKYWDFSFGPIKSRESLYKIESKINSFVEKGNEFHDDKKYAEALEQYQKAWQVQGELAMLFGIALKPRRIFCHRETRFLFQQRS